MNIPTYQEVSEYGRVLGKEDDSWLVEISTKELMIICKKIIRSNHLIITTKR